MSSKSEHPVDQTSRRRKLLVIVLAVCLLILFLVLAAQNAFSLRVLDPSTTASIFFFIALSGVGVVVFVGVLITLVRNVLKLYAEQRSRVLGARLRTRMLWGAVLISLVPISFLFCFSYLLMNRAVERWFSQPPSVLRDSARGMAVDLSHYVAANARAEAGGLATTLNGSKHRRGGDSTEAMTGILKSHEVTLQGGFAAVFSDNQIVAQFHLPHASQKAEIRVWADPVENQPTPHRRSIASSTLSSGPVNDILLEAAQRSDEPLVHVADTDYSVGSAWLQDGSLVMVALPLPYGMSSTIGEVQESAEQYWTLFRLRRQIRTTYMLLMLMITSLALFVACWLALHLSKQVTRPVEALADAMDEIAQGHYEHRVAETVTEELGELVQSFNAMASDLEQSRRLLDASNLRVFEANVISERRRRELETMLQTIPNGVVLMDSERYISIVNRAFGELLDPGGQASFTGTIDEVLPLEAREPILRLLRRCHRMGTATIEMEMPSSAGMLNIAATAALLETGLGSDRVVAGYVLVLENATELLHAQKQNAWKEVARRVAHEIKNPLTPISLSAEHIQRHIGRIAELLQNEHLQSASVETIQRSSQIISTSVESMRLLVDQFAALAQFPNSHPDVSDINSIVEAALVPFTGRLQGIRVIKRLAPALPPVMADTEALKRALTNLIDNAAEAMQECLVREIHISTACSDSKGMVEIAVADTGPGVTNEMRERLFLPYFSTKQRGTGLGLTITAKIVQEHQGTIRVEKNVPVGARFLIEIPTAATPAGEQDAVQAIEATE